MFGVVRCEILQQTSLLPDFAGSDRAMLTERALLGRFRCADKRLFLKRFHANLRQGDRRTRGPRRPAQGSAWLWMARAAWPGVAREDARLKGHAGPLAGLR
jgi:hypothetical protein